MIYQHDTGRAQNWDVRTVDRLMGPKAEGTLVLEIRDHLW